MLRSYDGPVSVAIGCRSAQEASQALRWAQASSKSMKRSLGVAGSTNTTASFIVDTVLYDSDSVTFPVNLLRNRAVSAAKTTHVLSLDVDFAPSAALCSHLTTQLQLLNLPNPVALVVATFETLSNSIPAPSTFKELMVQIEEGSSATVHEHFGPAHRPTEYGRYLAMTADNCAPAIAICQPYEIQYDALYEPYYALQKSANMPTYPESFTSYGNDKAAHAYELAEAGFTFAVALGVFATHMWHQPAKWSAAGNRDVVWMQWWTFTQEVAERYNKTSRRETPEWFREHLTYYNGGKWYPEKLSDCQNLNTLNWGRTPFSCKPSSNGRCGPRFGTYCSGERDLWCAESSGWCGSTGDHQRSQTSSAYHYKDAGLWREYCCKESLKLTYGKCLDAPQNTSGGKVHLWDCTPGIQNQQWTYTASTKQMKLVHGNKCLGIVDVALNAHAQRNEGRDEVRLWDCDLEKQNQQWTYMASTQQMKLTHGNKCLAVTDLHKNGGQVHQAECDRKDMGQMWLYTGSEETLEKEG